MHKERDVANTRFAAGNSGLKFSRPTFRIKTIIEKMFTSRNWTLNYDSTIIDRLAISSNAQEFFVTSYQKTFNTSFVLAGQTTVTGIDVNDFENDVTTSADNINISTTITAFRLRGTINADTSVKISVQSVGQGGITEQFDFFVDELTTDIDFTTPKIESAANNTRVFLLLEGTGNIEFIDLFYYSIIEEQDLGDLDANELIGYRVKVYDNLRDISQISLFMDTMVITNSILQPDSLNSIVNLKSLSKLSKLRAVDWSEKFEADSETISPVLSEIAKINFVEYNNDDTIDINAGRDFFETENENLKDETTYTQLDWGASIDTEINGFSIADFLVYDDAERINDINDRILFIFDDDDISPVFTMARFADLNWMSLKDSFYDNWFESFRRPRVITGMANLNKLDVLGFNFLDLVFIDNFDSYFFVLEISNFVSGQLTKIKLLKFL